MGAGAAERRRHQHSGLRRAGRREQSFQQRYLDFPRCRWPAGRSSTTAARAVGLGADLWPTCVFDGSGAIARLGAAAPNTPVADAA